MREALSESENGIAACKSGRKTEGGKPEQMAALGTDTPSGD